MAIMHKTTIRLPEELVENVHKYGGNVSRIARKALKAYVDSNELYERVMNKELKGGILKND